LCGPQWAEWQRDGKKLIGPHARIATRAAIDVDHIAFAVGCSIGIAVVPDDATSLAGALVVADGALYEAKRGGRNRVIDNAPPLTLKVVSSA